MNILKGYRTIIFNTATVIAGLSEMIGVINIIAPGYEAVVLLAVGVANLVLRYLTDTSVGVSVKED